MIVTCVYVEVKPDVVNSFIQATTDNHLESVKEPGNLRFDFLQQHDNPCRFMIYEAYESEDAVKAHKNTAHYLKWRDTVADWMASPRQGVRYDVIQPKERSGW